MNTEFLADLPVRIILELMRRLQMPFVTTLHTVLRDPDPDQRAAMEEIATLSDRLIVMSQQSSDILQESLHVPSNKIDLIPHGIPDLPFTDPTFYKDAFGTEGKNVLLTFGLLSPNKGIENVIKAQALPLHVVCSLSKYSLWHPARGCVAAFVASSNCQAPAGL